MTPKIVIESGIPIPKCGRPEKDSCLYPVRKLELGQSFLVPDIVGVRTQLRVSAIVSAATRRHYMEIVDGKEVKTRAFTTRKVEGGVRVWRVK